ncbi:hypothetical protein Tco_0608359 [Tanacetum coccineum]
MASLDYRLNPLFTIKECSSCGSLYNKGYCCTPDSSQQPLRDCPKCGNPVEGPNCQGCALWRKKLKEVWFTICHENGIYQDILNTYESSDDDTNVVNVPRKPFVVKQDPGENSSQSPPQINHNCCYECGDSLDGIFCHDALPQYETYSCELCGNDSHYGFDCPPRVPLVYEQEPCYNQNFSDNYYPQNSPSFSQQYLCCDNCGGPHATFQCHPMNQNFNSFGFDHIQPPQQFDNHQPQEIPEVTPFVESKEWIETNNELYKMMEDFMKRMNQQREQEALLVAQREQELREQEQAAQEKEELSPNFVFRQLIEETCGTKVCEEQKQNMEDTMLDLLKICQQKELYCIHNNVEDLIESALNSKLLLINLNSQRLNKEEQEVKNIAEPAAKRQTRITSCLQNFKVISKESTIPLNKTPQISPVNAITHDLPTEEPEDSLIMGNEELSTIPEKESDEFIKSSVEDLIPIPRESEDSSGSDSESVLPSSDDFSPIFEEKSVTFSNPLFEFDDEYISNDVNPLFDEVLENIESKDSYVSNLDEPALLVTPLSDANEDECFDPGGVIDEIDAFLDMDISTDIENGYHDSEGDIIYLESLLIDDTSPNLPPEVFLDHDPRSLKDEPDNDDLMTEDKVFDPGIYEKSFSLTFVKLTFEDRHYFPITFVIRIFLPYPTYSVDSIFLLSFGSKDTIFDPGISTFHFSSLKPVAYENPIVIFLFFYFCPKDKGIRGDSS